MGKPPQPEAKLFYYGLCLEDRIPPEHLLCKIRRTVDFDFTHDLVRKHYGVKGNVSVLSSVILKLMRLLFLYDVPSEREWMRALPTIRSASGTMNGRQSTRRNGIASIANGR